MVIRRVLELAGRSILEVQSDDPVHAMRALDAMEQVEKTSVFGTAVHAVIRARDGLSPETLRARLADAGISAGGIEPVEPSLEDVFLEVVAEAGH